MIVYCVGMEEGSRSCCVGVRECRCRCVEVKSRVFDGMIKYN
jgi:hypothetical protein